MNAYLFMLVFLVSISAFAAKPNQESSASQCLAKAKQIAKSLDQINGNHYADMVVTMTVEKVYLDAYGEDVAFAAYNFGNGESYLEIVINPDYYEKGDCKFVSAQVISQE